MSFPKDFYWGGATAANQSLINRGLNSIAPFMKNVKSTTSNRWLRSTPLIRRYI